MPQVVYAPEALADIRRLYRFLSQKDAQAAAEAIRAIRQALRLLGVHPEAGRSVRERPAAFREWVIEYGESGYVALYTFDRTECVVLAIKHQREMGYAR